MFAIVPKSQYFAHREALRIFQLVLRKYHAKSVIIDLSNVEDATTSAFARLVLLRRALRRIGGDLQLTGLHSRAQRIYELNGLQSVLPTLLASRK